MEQKFMLIAVGGYVLFCAGASFLVASASKSSHQMSSSRKFGVTVLHWAALLVFVVASFTGTAQLVLPNNASALWPLPSNVALSVLAAVVLSVVYGHAAVRSWWSPLPWLRGVIATGLVAAVAGAAQGIRHGLLPDWRFVGTSLVLWGACLILADLALLSSLGTDRNDTTTVIIRELLRLCAALPAILVYLIGIRL